jgi:hypothetical protein
MTTCPPQLANAANVTSGAVMQKARTTFRGAIES